MPSNSTKQPKKSANPISPKKLLNSKWTATPSIQKQKHFIITDVEYDECQNVVRCEIQAIINKHTEDIDWRDLRDSSKWLQGWK